MRHVTLVLTLLALPALAHADFMDAVKGAANSAVDGSKKSGLGKLAAGHLEKELNDRLLAEARKNQCSFKSDSDVLEAGCDKKAQKLATTMIDVKKKLAAAGVSGFKFEVSGHTDTRGAAAHNKELSAKRAAVMVKQLVAKGVSANEIISVGMGSEQPLVTPDDTPAKQAKNRRYEVRVRF
jgi:outer membrane protein OmpA-like peptidoglycan-associated protein